MIYYKSLKNYLNPSGRRKESFRPRFLKRGNFFFSQMLPSRLDPNLLESVATFEREALLKKRSLHASSSE